MACYVFQAGGQYCTNAPFLKYVDVVGIRVYPKSDGAEYEWNVPDLGLTQPAVDQQGYCQQNIEVSDFGPVTIAYDHTFWEFEKTVVIAGFPITGSADLTGEVGLKVGFAKDSFGGPNVKTSDKRCESGKMTYAIPYAKAEFTGELALDLAIVKGGVGIHVRRCA